MLLLIDNYDSFVFNLARYFRRLGQVVQVVRNTQINVDQIQTLEPDAVVLSPGPCRPTEAGCCLEVVRCLHNKLPLLGICLGHQVIVEALGGRIVRAAEPVHGQAWPIRHDGRGIFAGLDKIITVGRYHSLVADRQTLPPSLEVSAWTDDGTVMAVRHRRLPLVGLQFHPESILTELGYPLLAAYLRQLGLNVPDPVPTLADEYHA